MTTGTILLVVIVIAVVWAVLMYNKFIRLIQQVNDAWSDIDVQLKRRYDLIPNLMNTVQGYVDHEKETLQKVTEARTMAMGAQNPEEQGRAENMLTGALKSLFAVSEAYPDLKANQNFLELQKELSDTENKIQAARRFYNGNVKELNVSVLVFPANIIANMFKFEEKEYFDLDDNPEERENVEVKF